MAKKPKSSHLEHIPPKKGEIDLKWDKMKEGERKKNMGGIKPILPPLPQSNTQTKPHQRLIDPLRNNFLINILIGTLKLSVRVVGYIYYFGA